MCWLCRLCRRIKSNLQIIAIFKMLLRTSILPRSIKDALVTSFVLVIMPCIYYFELFVVLPRYYIQWSAFYNFHFCLGTFILFNLCAHLVAIVMCDTSIRGRLMPTEMKPGWRFCSVCETMAPPRSWHCETCDVCILKRDHHCMFTSCCIGQENHRFFLVFVLYMFVATMYASYYNISFLWDFITFSSWLSLAKIIFPMAALFMEWTENQLYVFFIMTVLLGGAFTGGLLYFHLDLMLRGVVTHERNEESIYDRGYLQNVKIVLGDKWYLVWLSPWIESKLPCDGINWSPLLSDKAK